MNGYLGPSADLNEAVEQNEVLRCVRFPLHGLGISCQRLHQSNLLKVRQRRARWPLDVTSALV